MTQPTLHEFMATNPDGTLEKIANEYQVSVLEVIKATANPCLISGEYFDHIFQEVSKWGSVTTLVNTPDIIFEFEGNLPAGKHGHGYFNLQGKEGFSGHIKAQNCQYIAFVERKFMGVDTASILFLNQNGDAMFKIFVGRDDKRQLKVDQLTVYRQLAQFK